MVCRRVISANGGEVGREDFNVRNRPTVDDLLHHAVLQLEVVAVDGGNAGVPNHLHDRQQVARSAPALTDVGRAGVAEVEEPCLLAGRLVPEHFRGDGE